MEIIIHRGTHQIGGCVTEIKSNAGTRIIIDVGAELPSASRKKNIKIEGLFKEETTDTAKAKKSDSKKAVKDCSAVFISHYHGDHIGEYTRVKDDIPIFMGKAAKEIFLVWQNKLFDLYEKNTQSKLSEKTPVKQKDINRIDGFEVFEKCDDNPEKYKPIEKSGITVTPIRTDHSAYDSYMFLVEADGQSVLHTGDFRTHGLTGNEVLENIKTALGSNKLEKISALICEGTLLSRYNIVSDNEDDNDAAADTEDKVYFKAKELMSRKENKNVFILCSAINIDAISTFYRAALDSKKTFVVLEEDFQLAILKKVKEFRENETKHNKESREKYSFDENKINIYINPDKSHMDLVNETGENGFCMMVRANPLSEQIITKFKDKEFLLIYSLWDGYLKDEFSIIEAYEQYSAFVEKIKDSKGTGSIGFKKLHTSGHATRKAIRDVIGATKPSVIIPIHGTNPEAFNEFIDSEDKNCKVVILHDKETYNIETGEIDAFDIGINRSGEKTEEWIKRIRYVKHAYEIWNLEESFGVKKYAEIKKRFHLRPFSTGIMIICTIPSFKYSMTGIKTTPNGDFKLKDSLDDIVKLMEENDISSANANIDDIKKYLHRINAKPDWIGRDGRGEEEEKGEDEEKDDRIKKKVPESVLQSNFINMLVNDNESKNVSDRENFEEKIKNKGLQRGISQLEELEGPLKFVASELVIHKGRSKKDIVDIVAYSKSNETLFILELKVLEKKENDLVPYGGWDGLKEQLKKYIRKYSRNGIRYEKMCEYLEHYPNYPIQKGKIKNVIFLAVIAKNEKDIGNMCELEVMTIEDIIDECKNSGDTSRE